jgi:hypothetical protein
MGKQRARLRSCCRSYCKPLPCPCSLHGPKRRSWTFPSPPYRILLSILLFMKTRFPSSCTHSFPVLYPLYDCTTECRHKRNARGNATKLFMIIRRISFSQEKVTRKANASFQLARLLSPSRDRVTQKSDFVETTLTLCSEAAAPFARSRGE